MTDNCIFFPSLFLFWSPSATAMLDDASLFLGPVSGPGLRRYLLPVEASRSSGSLILYSMARKEHVGAFVVPAGEGSGVD